MGLGASRIPHKEVCRLTPFSSILKYDHSGRIFMLTRRGGQRIEVRQVSVLSELAVGESGILIALDLPENVQNHLMHMGFVQDAHVTALRRAPAGDPTVYRIDGMEIALRHETAAAIRVRPIDSVSETQPASTYAPQFTEAAR